MGRRQGAGRGAESRRGLLGPLTIGGAAGGRFRTNFEDLDPHSRRTVRTKRSKITDTLAELSGQNDIVAADASWVIRTNGGSKGGEDGGDGGGRVAPAGARNGPGPASGGQEASGKIRTDALEGVGCQRKSGHCGRKIAILSGHFGRF